MPGENLLEPPGEACKGKADDEVKDCDEKKDLGWKDHTAVVDLRGNVG
jgi:hypothetical protein